MPFLILFLSHKQLFDFEVNRIYLAKDKQTLRSKGFAFVTYERRDEAEKAILTISGHKYDYVILKVEWAKQST